MSTPAVLLPLLDLILWMAVTMVVSLFREFKSFYLRNLQIEPVGPLRRKAFHPYVTGFLSLRLL